MAQPLETEPTGSSSRAEHALTRMVRQGRSFSGNERNCCFLNTRDGRFANVSFVSGIDFPDDARAIGAVDWDRDGVLDFWVLNRSGPQIRFLRGTASGGRSVALSLEGRSCNRDAIGARVELVVPGEAGRGPRRLVRSLRAGDGFLSQSSKWLHFGLAGADRIDRAEVRWPDGRVEEFGDLRPGGRYRLVQGTGSAEVLPVRATGLPAPAIAPAGEEVSHPRAWLAARVPMPRVTHCRTDLRPEGFWESPIAGPVLIHFWDARCRACVRELDRLSGAESTLRKSGLRVLAVNVEGVDRAAAAVAAHVDRFARQHGLPFDVGIADREMVDRVEFLISQLFASLRPLAAPMSLLVDREGRLAAIYRGCVDLPALLDDVAGLETGAEERRRRAVPFSGRWIAGETRVDLKRIVANCLQEKMFEDAEGMCREALRVEPHDAEHHYNLGLICAGSRRMEQAVNAYRRAVEIAPDFAMAYNQWGYALGCLDRFEEAIVQFRKALLLREDLAPAQINLGNALVHLHRYAEGIEHYRSVLAKSPGFADAHNNLGAIYHTLDRSEEAIAEYREAVRLNPDYADAHHNLALVLAEREQLEEARVHFLEVRRIAPTYPGIDQYLRRLEDHRRRPR